MADKKGKGKAAAEPKRKSVGALYKVDGSSISRLRRTCPKCGAGVFMAKHMDRESCGKCGHTEKVAAR